MNNRFLSFEDGILNLEDKVMAVQDELDNKMMGAPGGGPGNNGINGDGGGSPTKIEN